MSDLTASVTSTDRRSEPRLIFLFSGHMIDAPDRAEPRFPPDKESIASEAIQRKLDELDADPADLALCGGACGGDLLFAEACLERGLQLEVRIPFEESIFLKKSVTFAGDAWVDRFYKIKAHPNTALFVTPRELGPTPEDANPYSRNNVWQLDSALARGPKKVRFICLWNGKGGDGPGGTKHMYDAVSSRKGQAYIIDTNLLFGFYLAEAKNAIATQQGDPNRLLEISQALRRDNDFSHAREVLKIAREKLPANAPAALRRRLAQQHALCTYKDPDLPIDQRLDDALNILGQAEELSTTTIQEFLGLAGAIYKRKWEIDGQRKNLEWSLFYYYRGYKQGVEIDRGYTALNAAFVLDLLAAQEEDALSDIAHKNRQEASTIRNAITEKLKPLLEGESKEELQKDWWFHVTIAEAYFGLKNYKEATEWFRKAKELSKVAPWEFESTARQLASLARLHQKEANSLIDLERSDTWEVLREFFDNNLAGVRSVFLGKIGLALSGGGFRASFFHIGVLARLAELDMLRHVEVLSCVSGGSIIGAYYYLEIRKLLQTNADTAITRQQYIDIVKDIQKKFLDSVQSNIRTRVILNPWSNLKMLVWPYYSRTNRLAELFEKKIFSKVDDKDVATLKKPRILHQLYVKPLNSRGRPEDCKPKYDNWKRNAKVPTLILNATTLNTGHNWQFTASFMGEPPWSIVSEIDGNYRLRRMYHSEAPDEYRNVRLGQAVAASACVPGLFPPLAFPKLYQDKTVQLVDGGVHDNQGIMGLLEQGCTVLLVSDASGQMEAQDYPVRRMLRVSLRSASILGARVRGLLYGDIAVRERSSLLRGFMFVHLTKDLDTPDVEWVGCKDQKLLTIRPVTSYGIHKKFQKRVSAIRTDLDCFSEAEAYALMTSGYLMTKSELGKRIKGFPDKGSVSWPFRTIENIMNQDPEASQEARKLAEILDVAKYRGFKAWRLSHFFKIAALLLSSAGAWFLWILLDKLQTLLPQFSWTDIGLAIIALLLVSPLVGSIISLFHVTLVDPWYRHLGKS